MYRDILRRANFAIFLAIAALATVIQSTIFGYFPLNYIQPDLLLIMAVYMGFRRSVLEGGAFVAIAAIMQEAHSGTGDHFFLAVYVYTYLIAKVLSRTVVVPDFFSSIGIVAALTLLKRVGLLLLIGTVGHAENGIRHFFIYIVPGLLVQSLLTPLCFSWFAALDLRTYKDEHAEDEYDINKGF